VIFTYITYISTLFLSTLFAFVAGRLDKKSHATFFFFLSTFVIIFVTGFRDITVGTDTEFYAEWFYEIDSNLPLLDNILLYIIDYEPGYVVLNHFLAGLNVSFTIASLTYAVIIWFFIYKSFSDTKEILYLSLFFFITTGFLFFTFNGIRQAIAVSLIFYSLRYLLKDKSLIFLLIVVIASLFHFSALLLSSLLLINKLKKVNLKFLSIMLFSSLLLPGTLFYGLVFKIASIFPFYASYFERINAANTGFSFGVFYQMLLGFVLLAYYKSVANTKIQILVFHLSFIGAILYNLFYGSALLARFYIYFIFFQNYAFAYLMNFLIKNKRSLEALSLILIFFLVFLYRILVGDSGSSPYLFGIN